jgi:hypothetical protein
MATKKSSGRENVGRSVEQAHGVTAGRTTQERRIGSGNVRSGGAAALKKTGASSTSKTRSTTRPSIR